VPGVPSAVELSALPAAELAVRLAEAYRLIAELTVQAGLLTAQIERLSARVEELERQALEDSSTSSRPLPPIARISLWALAAWGSRETWGSWPGAGGHGPACSAVGVLPVRRPAP